MTRNSAVNVHGDALELTGDQLEAVSGGVLPFLVGVLVGGLSVAAGLGVLGQVGDEIIKPVPGLVYN